LDQRRGRSKDMVSEDDDPGLRKASDFKQRQVRTYTS
jgi:hypothetical protein